VPVLPTVPKVPSIPTVPIIERKSPSLAKPRHYIPTATIPTNLSGVTSPVLR
jgi:hypothetical protein